MARFGLEPTIVVVEISTLLRALDHTVKVSGRLGTWDHNFLHLVSKFRASGSVSPLLSRSCCSYKDRGGGEFHRYFPILFCVRLSWQVASSRNMKRDVDRWGHTCVDFWTRPLTQAGYMTVHNKQRKHKLSHDSTEFWIQNSKLRAVLNAR
jgi:hypothetical protein